MCRLFGFRSVLQSHVHKSLLRADNALVYQSEKHPDGWGVCYYVEEAPHIIRSISTALDDSLFHRISGVVTSQTVIAHLRKSTVGTCSILNTHPFQYGKWTFAHNGNIKFFIGLREKLKALIDKKLQPYILGETDSELIFYIILTHLQNISRNHQDEDQVMQLEQAIRVSMQDIQSISGPFCQDAHGDPNETYLTFVITDGQIMMGYQGGKSLHFSTYKNQCSERDTCPFLSHECEHPITQGHVNHLIFSSEPLLGENIWTPMTPGQIIGVDSKMNLRIS